MPAVKTSVNLPPELVRAIAPLLAAEGVALPDLMVRLLRRHVRKLAAKPPTVSGNEHEHLAWRQELL